MVFDVLVLSLVIQFFMFVPAFIFKTDKLTDLSYALTFIILSFLVLLKNELTFPSLVLFGMISLWALRLGVYLFIRIRKIKRDKRFDGIREDFFKFLVFWTIQGVTVFLVLISSVLFFKTNTVSFSIFSSIGLVAWFVGMFIEGVSDYQKYVFINNTKNKDKFVNVGFWKYSQHPNYFGEILTWVGVYVYVFNSITLWLGLISPLFIFFMLLKVSGIPTIEKSMSKRFGKNKKYQDYVKKTRKLLPLPKF